MSPVLEWSPAGHWQRITVIDSHTGGEPFRVILDGLPEIPGDSIVARRSYAMEHLDHYRKLLMWEPRGHADMYGALLGPPVAADSHISVLFMHNSGFSTMCGHGIIALTKIALETGLVASTGDPTTIRIDTPAGQVTSTAKVEGGSVTEVSFRNVPSYAVDLDAAIELPSGEILSYDLAFGGAFYAYVDAATAGVSLDDGSELVAAGRTLKAAISDSRAISHPLPELGFLYGVIFTGPARDPLNHSRNVCVFADGEIDRSPTGTGVSGRVAIAHARDQLTRGEPMVVESIVGSTFTGRWIDETEFDGHAAVVPEVTGTAHITGRAEFWVDPEDEIGKGFLIR